MQRADIVLRPVIGRISKREIRFINWKTLDTHDFRHEIINKIIGLVIIFLTLQRFK